MHSGITFSVQHSTEETNKRVDLPTLEVKPLETDIDSLLEAGWKDELDEVTKNEYRIVKLGTILRSLERQQVLKRRLNINIDIELRNAESQLSEREHEVTLMPDCINSITRRLLADKKCHP
jgi:hypothetical protein